MTICVSIYHYLVLHPVWNSDLCFTEDLDVSTVHITYNVHKNNAASLTNNFPFQNVTTLTKQQHTQYMIQLE